MMSGAVYAVLFLLISIFFNLSYSYESAINLCPENEKHALLTFKQSLHDSQNLLSSWDAEADCCKWRGVVCSNSSSGHVLELHLLRSGTIGGKITSSLLNLKHLTYLDLSYNSFSGETIPSFIGSFTDLQYLNLSDAGFVGKIPCNIANLSNLHALSLEYNYGLDVDSLEWLSGLSKLEYLNMRYVNLSRATHWSMVISSQLPCLHELNLSECDLDLTSPLNAANLTSLTLLDLSRNGYYQENTTMLPIPPWCFQLNNLLSLDLSYNHLKGPFPTAINATKLRYIHLSFNQMINSSIPAWLYFCKDLEFVDLSYTSLQGEISEAIGNLTSLQTLHLYGNELSGKLPREITSLCRLQSLHLSNNKLRGEVQNVFGNMSGCFLGSLIDLRMSINQLSGHLTQQFGEFKRLGYLDLEHNSLSGAIPISLGNLSSLVELSLNDNSFTGNLPESLSQLHNLYELYIENNRLEGIVSESHLSNFSTLTTFSASGNHLTLNVGPNWVPPIQLEGLLLGSWSLGAGNPSQLPSWLRTQRNITDQLDVSDAGISGSIPTWFFDVRTFLNASHNSLHGKIPLKMTSQRWDSQHMYMSNNKLRGSLPRIGASVEHLDLSHNLFTQGLSNLLCDQTNETSSLELLNLEGNRLSGELPDCSWKRRLSVLKLGNNTMSGSLPNSIGFLSYLEILSLRGNQFSGPIPDTMQNCKKLWKIDLGHNNLNGNIPAWMGTSLVELEFLILRSNKFSGEISPEICHLQSLQILDLSNNQISNKIPRCLSNLTAMATKRELHSLQSLYGGVYYFYFVYLYESASVVTKGVEREYKTILSLVTNLDLSMNNLSGDIPKELTRLVELGSLNLSGNHLTGSIPESIGEMKKLESLDLSQNSLSGQIPDGFTLLSSLSRLNLSFNNLTGTIPRSTQLQTLEPSSFVGNDLCGPPLSNCTENDGQREENEGGDDDETSAGIDWLYIFLSLGFAVGFSGVCTALVVKNSWRYAYFGLAESIWNKLYVCFYVNWARLTRTGV